MPVYLAKALGYYDQEHVAVALEEVASATKSMQSLIGRSSDLATGGFMSVVSMNAEHRPVQAFLVMVRYPAIAAFVSPRAQRNISRLEDMAGSTVGVAGIGSDEHMVVNFVSSRHGVNPATVGAVAVGAGMSKASAFEHGSVDVVAAVGTTVSLIQKRYPGALKLFDLCSSDGVREHLGFEDLAYSVLYGKTDWIRQHREAVMRVASATRRASDWARSHSPAEVRERLPASMRTEDVAVDIDAIGIMLKMLSPDGAFTPQHLRAAREILAVSNPSPRKERTDLSESYTNEFLKAGQK